MSGVNKDIFKTKDLTGFTPRDLVLLRDTLDRLQRGGTSGEDLSELDDVPAEAGTLPTANLDTASQADVTAGTSTTKVVTPESLGGLSTDSPIKAWVVFDGTAVDGVADLTGVDDSFNIASVVDNGTGDYTINLDTDFGSAHWAWAGGLRGSGGGSSRMFMAQAPSAAKTAGSIRVNTVYDNNTKADPDIVTFIAVGDQ